EGFSRPLPREIVPHSRRGSEQEAVVAETVVLYEIDDKVSVITLNRPDKLNAISPELMHQLLDAFARADAEPATSVVLLRAEGRSFCAGYDIGARPPAPQDDWRSDPIKAHKHLAPQLAFEMPPGFRTASISASTSSRRFTPPRPSSGSASATWSRPRASRRRCAGAPANSRNKLRQRMRRERHGIRHLQPDGRANRIRPRPRS